MHKLKLQNWICEFIFIWTGRLIVIVIVIVKDFH